MNQAMSEKYPNLWPVYRDQVLVEMAERVNGAYSNTNICEEASSHDPSGGANTRIGGRDPRDIRPDAGTRESEIHRS